MSTRWTCAEKTSGQIGSDLSHQHCAAEPRAFENVGAAKDFRPGLQCTECPGLRGLQPKVRQVFQKRIGTAAAFEARNGVAACVLDGLLRGNEGDSVCEKEIAILPGFREVVAGKMRVNAIVRRAGRGAKVLVGTQAGAPNTREKIWSMRFRWYSRSNSSSSSVAEIFSVTCGSAFSKSSNCKEPSDSQTFIALRCTSA